MLFCSLQLVMSFTKRKIILILSTTKRQATYVFALDLEIYTLLVSALAFALSYDFFFQRHIIFLLWRSFLYKSTFFLRQGNFPRAKIFLSLRKFSTNMDVFRKKWFFLDRKGFPQATGFPQEKIFPLSKKYSTRKEFFMIKEVFHIKKVFLTQWHFPGAIIFPWSKKLSRRKYCSLKKKVFLQAKVFPQEKIFPYSRKFFTKANFSKITEVFQKQFITYKS